MGWSSVSQETSGHPNKRQAWNKDCSGRVGLIGRCCRVYRKMLTLELKVLLDKEVEQPRSRGVLKEKNVVAGFVGSAVLEETL